METRYSQKADQNREHQLLLSNWKILKVLKIEKEKDEFEGMILSIAEEEDDDELEETE